MSQKIDPSLVQKEIEVLSKAQMKWRELSVSERQKILKTTHTRLLEQKKTVALLITEEMGKPIRESLAEVEKCIKTIELCCTEDLSQLQSRDVPSIYSKSKVIHQPLGVIYSIMPWNFPLWQAVRMIYPSLLAGNTVLLKHSEITHKMGDFIQQLFAGIWSESLLRHWLIPHELTETVIRNPKIGGVSLTGSTRAGKTISELAGKYFKKCVLELGGSDPYLVFADADLEKAAKVIASARLMNAGQSCICAKRCLVENSVKEKFLELLKQEFDRSVFGNPFDEKTTLGPLAHPQFVQGLSKQIQELITKTSAKLVYEKKHHQDQTRYVNSSIYLLQENSEWLKDQEFFAPVLLVIPFLNQEEAIAIANSTDFALGAGVWSQDLCKAQKVAEQILAGQIVINEQVKSDYHLPFGGFKQSGIGRELGLEGFLEFTETKIVSL